MNTYDKTLLKIVAVGALVATPFVYDWSHREYDKTKQVIFTTESMTLDMLNQFAGELRFVKSSPFTMKFGGFFDYLRVDGTKYDFEVGGRTITAYKLSESSNDELFPSDELADLVVLDSSTVIQKSPQGLAIGSRYLQKYCSSNCKLIASGPKLERILDAIPRDNL